MGASEQSCRKKIESGDKSISESANVSECVCVCGSKREGRNEYLSQQVLVNMQEGLSDCLMACLLAYLLACLSE